MAVLDFQGEIIAIDLPNPEDTQIWVGENELLHSRQHQCYFCSFRSLLPPLFDKYGLDAMVTVWLTWKKNLKSEMFWTTQVACWLKQLETGKLTSTDYFSS